MLSMSPAMSAGQAGRYFSKEDYYLRSTELGENSKWCGEGAQALGLDGPVREEEFRALCHGDGPSGKRIVNYNKTHDKAADAAVETHRAGNDCTFSAPKSVSIAYAAGFDSAKDAHDAAVGSIAGYLEKHHSFYRSPSGLQHGKLVAAKFDHTTSRHTRTSTRSCTRISSS